MVMSWAVAQKSLIRPDYKSKNGDHVDLVRDVRCIRRCKAARPDYAIGSKKFCNLVLRKTRMPIVEPLLKS